MQEYLKKLGYGTIDNGFYEHITSWLAWYKGKVDSFHKYNQYNGKTLIGRERATLGMAKKVCEDWANLLLNEKVEFTASQDSDTQRARKILDSNNFRVKGNRLIELAFALGTGAFVEYKAGETVKIDYIRANMIYPISWDNGEITECAFGSEKTLSGKPCVYLQIHILERGQYIVKNHLFDKRSKEPLSLPADVKPVFHTKSQTPLFQIIMPNLINNIDLDNPMGISVFANAIDVLKGVDLVYDSYQNEFRLGKKRIIVPAGMAQLQSGETGLQPLFDDNDTEFYALPDKSMTDLKEINMELRSAAHSEGLQQNLNLLSDKCGLGNDRYSYEQGNVKTATEVISENSDLFRNLKKHEIIIGKAFQDLIRAVLFLDGSASVNDIRVDFDDSIIEDTQSERTQDRADVTLGVMAKWEYRVKWYKEGEDEAKQRIIDEFSGVPEI